VDKKKKKEFNKFYDQELLRLQTELVKLQEYVFSKKLKIIILFEGRDASGKGGIIKRIRERTNPRIIRSVALVKPTEREISQWYFQRYVAHLPSGGEIVIFDRSWYNRACVEKVMGFCTDKEYREFLRTCPIFEKALARAGIKIYKYWLSVNPDVQNERFKERINDPMKRWKFSEMDILSREKFLEYSKAKDKMFAYTDTNFSPWFCVDANNKKKARLNCLSHLLSRVDYDDLDYKKIKIPKIDVEKLNKAYERPLREYQNWVPDRYEKY